MNGTAPATVTTTTPQNTSVPPVRITEDSIQPFLTTWNSRDWPAAAGALEKLIRDAERAGQAQLAQVLRHLRGIAAGFAGYHGVAKAIFEESLKEWDGKDAVREGSREAAALTWLATTCLLSRRWDDAAVAFAMRASPYIMPTMNSTLRAELPNIAKGGTSIPEDDKDKAATNNTAEISSNDNKSHIPGTGTEEDVETHQPLAPTISHATTPSTAVRQALAYIATYNAGSFTGRESHANHLASSLAQHPDKRYAHILSHIPSDVKAQQLSSVTEKLNDKAFITGMDDDVDADDPPDYEIVLKPAFLLYADEILDTLSPPSTSPASATSPLSFTSLKPSTANKCLNIWLRLPSLLHTDPSLLLHHKKYNYLYESGAPLTDKTLDRGLTYRFLSRTHSAQTNPTLLWEGTRPLRWVTENLVKGLAGRGFMGHEYSDRLRFVRVRQWGPRRKPETKGLSADGLIPMPARGRSSTIGSRDASNVEKESTAEAGLTYIASFVIVINKSPGKHKYGVQIPAHLIRDDWTADAASRPPPWVQVRLRRDIKDMLDIAEARDTPYGASEFGDSDGGWKLYEEERHGPLPGTIGVEDETLMVEDKPSVDGVNILNGNASGNDNTTAKPHVNGNLTNDNNGTSTIDDEPAPLTTQAKRKGLLGRVLSVRTSHSRNKSSTSPVTSPAITSPTTSSFNSSKPTIPRPSTEVRYPVTSPTLSAHSPEPLSDVDEAGTGSTSTSTSGNRKSLLGRVMNIKRSKGRNSMQGSRSSERSERADAGLGLGLGLSGVEEGDDGGRIDEGGSIGDLGFNRDGSTSGFRRSESAGSTPKERQSLDWRLGRPVSVRTSSARSVSCFAK